MEKVMEFSNEELLEISWCPMDYHDTTRNLAKALLSERAERENNPGVWDGAPEWATDAGITWSAKTHYSGVYKNYTRELPKTKAREIAERAEREWSSQRQVSNRGLVAIIESAINEAMEGEK